MATTPRERTAAQAASDAAERDATLGDIRAVGGKVVTMGTVQTDAGPRSAILADLPSAKAALELLQRTAQRASYEPIVRDFARWIRGVYMTDQATAMALHAWMQGAVSFDTEVGEIFQRAVYTAQRGVGDCDDHTMLLAALGAAAGLKTRLLPFRVGTDDPQHVCVEFFHNGAWHPAETTIGARYGEDPVAAAQRLGHRERKDMGQ